MVRRGRFGIETTIESLRKDILEIEDDEDGSLNEIELDTLRECITGICLCFEDYTWIDEAHDITVENFDRNDGMFIFDIVCGREVLGFDYDKYLEEQVVPVSDELELVINPLLLQLYDEISYGRDHGVLRKIAPEIAHLFLDPENVSRLLTEVSENIESKMEALEDEEGRLYNRLMIIEEEKRTLMDERAALSS